MKYIRNIPFVLLLAAALPGSALAQESEPLYDLGELPEGFEIRWPEPPVIEHETAVATAAEFNAAAATPGTAIVVTAAIPSSVNISASDIEVRMEEGASVLGLNIGRGVKRVRVLDSRVGARGITMVYPSSFYPTRVTDPNWVIEDVLFDNVEVESEANASAINLRGNRIALLNSYLRGGEYAIWSDTSAPLVNSDVIIAGNVLQVEGDQATVRLVGIHNAVVVDNRIENLLLTGYKHNFRIHGESDQVYAARNLLVNAGTMFGNMPGDTIGEMWFDDNVIHHVTEDLFHPQRPDVIKLHARGNTAYSERRCFICFEPPPDWDVENNEHFPYEPAPELD